MDCVDINLMTHSQQVPVHPLSLMHGQPRQGGIEPAIDCCAGNTQRGKGCQLSVNCMGAAQIRDYKAHTAPSVPAVSVPQLSYLSSLLTEVTCTQGHAVAQLK